MKNLAWMLFLLTIISGSLSAQPFTTDSNTVALWHFDELSGSLVIDSSPHHNNGTAVGAIIVSGHYGNARSYNGSTDYVNVPNPADGSLGFGPTQSFSIEATFKTTSLGVRTIVRKGLAQAPGFDLRLFDGHVQAQVGNDIGGLILTITSMQSYNDGLWHSAKFVRDRSARTLLLYVDGLSTTQPMDDSISFALSSDRPLNIGRWEGLGGVEFFNGTIDEIRLSKIPSIAVNNDTVAMWHFDEEAGAFVYESSPYHNNGAAYNASIVPGHLSLARLFNGTSSYVNVPDAASLNFGPHQSFTIEAWFKSTGTGVQTIIRKALAPRAGYDLRLIDGHVQAEIGNRLDGTPPDTVLQITSGQLYNDGSWHHATVVRDSLFHKIFLYVDNIPATQPITDNFPYALVSDRPINIGRQEELGGVEYFNGVIDELYIFKGARHPGAFGAPFIQLSRAEISFGNVPVGNSMFQPLTISNVGLLDTLRITSITSNNPRFSSDVNTAAISAGLSRTIQVTYDPTVAQLDTGIVLISSNDPIRPVITVRLSGRGFQFMPAPVINTIRDIAGDQGKQVRVTWYRSIYDGVLDSLHVATYNIWRRVDQVTNSFVVGGSEIERTAYKDGHPYLHLNAALWDFIATIPAVQFEQYAYVAPTLVDSTRDHGIRWSIFQVSAHTASGQIFFSAPDSGYSIDNIAPHPPTNVGGNFVNGHVTLGWDPSVDPDFYQFVLYRNPYSGFIPSEANRIGTTNTNTFIDQNIAGLGSLYYRIATTDTAGNQSDPSEEARIVLTSQNEEGEFPTDFNLYQNYPNPFNPETNITYDVPHDSHITLTVFDLNGRTLAVLVDERKTPGRYSIPWRPLNTASGVYWCRLDSGSRTITKKLMLLR